MEPFDCAAITTSSGLGPAKGLVVIGVGEAAYGSVKRLTGRLGGERALELNIVFAKAEGSAWSNSNGGADIGTFSWVPETFSACGEDLSGFSWGSEFFLFRSGNPRGGCLDVGAGLLFSGSSERPLLKESPDIGFSTPKVPFDFCSWAFFLRAAARACNFDTFGAPSDEPPRSPPRGYNGAIKTP